MKIPAEVFRLARGNARLLLASADAAGIPHLDAAGGLACLAAGRIQVRYWFCPQTLSNIGQNPRCSLVIWDAAADRGYQLAGEVDAVREGGVLDGYSPQDAPLPQVEHHLTIRVDRVLEFRHAPHTDRPVVPSAHA
jgi:Pyridoxamine 5'-phosphate oxidase